MEKYCLNCGHDCHCGSDCIKEYDKGNKIVCCGHCRCNKDEIKTTNNEDLFNQTIIIKESLLMFLHTYFNM